MVSAVSRSVVVYVDPRRGRDQPGHGSAEQPYKTLTWALGQVQAGATIQLEAGQYDAASGEQFPLRVPTQVAIAGDEVNWGKDIIVTGGGLHTSSGFVPQNVTFVMQPGSELRGVTVSNSSENGTGVWIESADPTLAHNTFTKCGREGVFISGNANPALIDNVFEQNQLSGISMVHSAKGEIHRNAFRRTGYGLAIGEQAAPLVIANRVTQNQVGILVWGQARPVLRQNVVEQNQAEGLVMLDQVVVDLGHPQNPGLNMLRRNGSYDLRNATESPVQSVGNDLNPTRVQGLVEWVASEVYPLLPLQTAPNQPDGAVGGGASANPVSTRFQDLTEHWSAPFVEGLANLNIVRGFLDGTFRPNAKITRAQYAAILMAAFRQEAVRPATNFVDVSPQFWAYEAIRQASTMGFLTGFPDGAFRPDANLTRVQSLVSLVNGLKLTGGTPNSLQIYRDRAQIPPYAVSALEIATQRRLVVNYPHYDELNPMREMTRGEMAATVYQALVVQGRAPVIASPYIVRPDTTIPFYADTQGHWAADFIYGLTNQQMVSGFVDGTFRPDLPITRAEYTVLLKRVFDPPAKRGSIQFSDVPPNFWAAAAIQQAYQAEFLSGFPNQTFAPNQPLSRVQLYVSLINGLNLDAEDESILNFYQDHLEIPEFARPFVASATVHHFVVNFPDVRQLRPNHPATRAEVAAVIYQAGVYTGRFPAVTSPYIIG